MRTLLLFLLPLLGLTATVRSFSQGSYVQELTIVNSTPTTGMFLWGIENYGLEGLSLLASIYNSPPGIPTGSFQIIDLNTDGSFESGFGIGSATMRWSNPWSYKRRGNYHATLFRGFSTINNREALFVLNFETGNFWARQTAFGTFIGGSVCLTSSDRVLTPHYYFNGSSTPNKLGFSVFELNSGVPIWSRFYKKSGTGTLHYRAYDVQEFPTTDFSVMGLNYLLKISPDGNILSNAGIGTDSLGLLSHSIDGNGNVYVGGVILEGGDTVIDIFGITGNNRNGFIAKLDANYNLLWAKKLEAEQFIGINLNLKTFPDGNVVFTYSTYGDLPVISGKISPDGELLWHRGYEFYRPKINLGSDTSIYFVTNRKYAQDGTWEDNVPILAKTDANGDIAGCPQFAACLSLIDMPLILETWEWTHEPAPPLPEIDVEVAPINFSTTPHCGTPEPPSPVFSLPDTACQFSCLSPGDLKNRLAHHRQWRITGPGLDTIIVDSTFSWCYEVPGLYTIEQEIWLLGCSDIYSRNLKILPDNLAPPLGEDRSLCDDPPYPLIPSSSRPLRSFLWGDGSDSSSFNVAASGAYHLTASDGFCNISDTVALHFVRAGLTELPLDLGPDTTICPVFLPYILRPQSPYADAFFLNDAPQPAQEFTLSQPGNYTISTLIEDCLFSETIRLEVEPCPVPIYLPNAFSPNDDGINDRCFPQGEDYEGIRLEVFDRWGGMLHRTTAAPFSWDGKSDGKPLGHGVYVVVFYYKNLRTLQEEQLAKDVLLLR